MKKKTKKNKQKYKNYKIQLIKKINKKIVIIIKWKVIMKIE